MWLECINLHFGSKIHYGIKKKEKEKQGLHEIVKVLQNVKFYRAMGVSRMSYTIFMTGLGVETNVGTS